MKRQIIAKFLNAVNTWRFLVIALMRSMFYWRKEAENLKRSVDAILFCKNSEV